MDIAMPARMMRLLAARTRIACLLAVIMPFAVFARTILVPPQPVSPYLDTEVSTNCVLRSSKAEAPNPAAQPVGKKKTLWSRFLNFMGIGDV